METLTDIFTEHKKKFKCTNHIFSFIKAILAPDRHFGRSDHFEYRRSRLNEMLSFSGLEFCADGEFRQCKKADTLEEAEKRVQIIRQKLLGRSIHPEAMKYCRSELMKDNYFHAIFEAIKGLAQRIRDKSGIGDDGSQLIDKVFMGNEPILAINTLRTSTEISEQRGFAALLKGCFSAIRNPMAHEPKIFWAGEEDAADYLTFISLLHRKLDSCIKILR